MPPPSPPSPRKTASYSRSYPLPSTRRSRAHRPTCRSATPPPPPPRYPPGEQKEEEAGGTGWQGPAGRGARRDMRVRTLHDSLLPCAEDINGDADVELHERVEVHSRHVLGEEHEAVGAQGRHLRAVHVFRQVRNLEDGQDVVGRDVVGNYGLGVALEVAGLEALRKRGHVAGQQRSDVGLRVVHKFEDRAERIRGHVSNTKRLGHVVVLGRV
mmetsp:Transcript_24742/g.69271  ORF Transcript_24742/g.69271 Transcript_24742/m.69271 type:complete len:213 (+) Transcript_24742:284-922(+)